MNDNKIIELFHKEEFLSKLMGLRKKEEVINLFKQNGAEITADEFDNLYKICSEYISNNKKLIDDDLKKVSGGQGIDFKEFVGKSGKELGKISAEIVNCWNMFFSKYKEGYESQNKNDN